jgi:hypothetical protein
MQTVTGVGSSLWIKKAAGLPNIARRKFPINGLVFYAPLWHPELNTSPFISKDLNAHSCTVTGATWGIQGRTFDGAGNNINCGDNIALDLTTNITVLTWVYLTGNLGGFYTSASRDDAASARNWTLQIDDSNRVLWRPVQDGTGKSAYGANNSISQNTWYLMGGSCDGTTSKAWLNGAVQGTTAACTSIDNDDVSLYIGLRSGGSSPFAGVIGEVWIYNIALTQAGHTQIYQSTKWRYS